jgi:predicted membrane protein
MSIQPSYPNHRSNNGKVFAGLILLAVGSLLLLRQFDFFFFPGWLFSWPVILIVIGVFTGIKHDFKKPTSFILIIIGFVFLSGRILPWFDLRSFIFPIVIIALGLWLIVRRNNQHHPWDKKVEGLDAGTFTPGDTSYVPEADYTVKPDGYTATERSYGPTGDDYLDALAIFGGVKRIIMSKDFKGGEIVNIFGGAEIDFTRADINGMVTIEITQVFGGTKLVVPPHWQVRSDLAAVFAGIDDKRFGNTGAQSADKVLVLKGVSIFAGVDVRSF